MLTLGSPSVDLLGSLKGRISEHALQARRSVNGEMISLADTIQLFTCHTRALPSVVCRLPSPW